MMIACAHATSKRNGNDRLRHQRLRYCLCGKRWTAAMMAGIAGHVWSFGELFETVLADARMVV